MTPQQILEKIIEKAVKGGWQAPKSYTTYHATEDGEYWRAAFDDYYNVEKFFFDHSFAKAFWSNKEHEFHYQTGTMRCECGDWYEEYATTPSETSFCWQYHLINLALTPPEERLSYLEEYL